MPTNQDRTSKGRKRANSLSSATLFLLSLFLAIVAHGQSQARRAPHAHQSLTSPPNSHDAIPPFSSGELRIVGYNDMAHMLEAIDKLYVHDHPGSKPKLSLLGTATGAGALTLGFSELAPMGAEFSARELAAYQANVGDDPLRIRVAHCSLNPSARSAPIGIYVNVQNPLARLTVEQVARIFSTGFPDGDFTAWSQLTDDKEWAHIPIHACGIAEEAAAGLSNYMLSKMGGHSYTLTYTPLLQSRDAVQCVAGDKAAIAFASANILNPNTKLLAIATTEKGPYVLPTEDQIVAGNYPFDRFLYMYLRKLAGAPLNPAAKDYVELMLSRPGQRAIAAASPGYLPLNAEEIAVERKRLE